MAEAPVAYGWAHPDLRRQCSDGLEGEQRRRAAALRDSERRIRQTELAASAEVREAQAELQQLRARMQELLVGMAAAAQRARTAGEVAAGLEAQREARQAMAGSERAAHAAAVRHRLSAAAPVAPPLLDVGLLHLLRRTVSAAAPREPSATAVRAFLNVFAPLFTVDGDTRAIAAPPPLPTPCLAGPGGADCRALGCRYTHADQAAHTRRAVAATFEALAGCAEGDARRCGVVRECVRLAADARAAPEPLSLAQRAADALNRAVAHGWHRAAADGGWPAPLSHAAAAGGGWGPAEVEAALRNAAELQAWRRAREGPGACAAFSAAPSSVAWRVLLREAPSAAGRAWLAERGAALFPGCPQLHVARVLCLCEGGEAPPEECARVCLAGSAALAAQVAAAAALEADDRYCQVASRCVAFAAARCAVCLSARDADCAERLLAEVLADSGGRYALLPAAVVNLTALLVVLRQTGALADAEALPLAAISDVPFCLAEPLPSRPLDSCGPLLNGCLEMLGRCQEEMRHPPALDELRAAAQTSLVSAFALGVRYTEQLTRKLAPGTDAAHAAQWLGYVQHVRRLDGDAAAREAAQTMLGECAGAPLLALLLLQELEDMRLTCDGAAATLRDAFARAAGVDARRLADADYALSLDPAVSPTECVALTALHARAAEEEVAAVAAAGGAHTAAAEALTERLRLLRATPLALYTSTFTATSVLLTEELRVAAGLAETQRTPAPLAETVERFLCVLREEHLRWWSPLDPWFPAAVGTPHYAALLVYQLAPSLVRGAAAVAGLRRYVLDVSAQLGVLHPLLRDGTL